MVGRAALLQALAGLAGGCSSSRLDAPADAGRPLDPATFEELWREARCRAAIRC
jgi:hypothetical protein